MRSRHTPGQSWMDSVGHARPHSELESTKRTLILKKIYPTSWGVYLTAASLNHTK